MLGHDRFPGRFPTASVSSKLILTFTPSERLALIDNFQGHTLGSGPGQRGPLDLPMLSR